MEAMKRLGGLRVSLLDIRVGLRMLARYPGLTLVATIAIAVAIALGATYFEAVDKLLNPRIPVPDGDLLVAVHVWDTEATVPDRRMLHDFAVWRDQVGTIDELGAAVVFTRNLETADGRIEPVRGAEISASAFRLMGARPLLGRALTEQDEQPAGPPVAVLGDLLWRTRFEGDPDVVGRSVQLGTSAVTIVGVMPEGFAFPTNERIWVPLRVGGSTIGPRSGPAVAVFGRLAAGVSTREAEAELTGIGARLAADNPDTHARLQARVLPYGKPLADAGPALMIRTVLYAVNVAFLMLLAIVSINVATLVYARTATRDWEITVRTALGAGRGRIVMQLFIEALVLAALAATIGLLVAKAGLGWGLGRLAGNEALPFWIDDSLSWRTVLYTGALTLLGAAIVGVLPALRVTKQNVQDALRRDSSGRSTLRFGGLWTTIIVAQVAITVAFLPLAAGGAFQSNRFAQRAGGIGADRYITAVVGFDHEDHETDSSHFATRARLGLDELERRLAADPEVEHVTFADRLPVMDQFKYRIEVEGTDNRGPESGLRTSTLVHVSRGFFGAFRTSVVAGRDFAPLDFETRNVIVVNESFARHVLGGRSPLGQRVRIVSGEGSRATGEAFYEIVGMVRDFGWQLPAPQEQSAMYRPTLPTPGGAVNLAVRARDPGALATRLRRIAADVDPRISLTEVQPLTDVGGAEASTNWALTSVAWAVSFVVLLLSATGIHALMSFTVARRTREIGIRTALGAHSGRIVRSVFSRAFIQIGLGVLAGSALALLIGLDSTTGVLLLLAADGVMLLVGIAACLVPLRRALRIEPTEALRMDG